MQLPFSVSPRLVLVCDSSCFLSVFQARNPETKNLERESRNLKGFLLLLFLVQGSSRMFGKVGVELDVSRETETEIKNHDQGIFVLTALKLSWGGGFTSLSLF